MSSAYQIHVMLLQESRNDIGTECEGYTTIVFAPTGDIFVGIRPEEIAEETTVRDLIVISKSSGRLSALRETARKVAIMNLHLLGA